MLYLVQVKILLTKITKLSNSVCIFTSKLHEHPNYTNLPKITKNDQNNKKNTH